MATLLLSKTDMKAIMTLLFLFWPSVSFSKYQPLAIGETLQLKTSPLIPISIQKKGILSFKDQGHQILIIGKKIGKTKVRIGQTSYQIEVLKKERFETYQQLTKWLKNKRGPSLEVIKGHIELRGRILSLKDFKDLSHFTTSYSQFKVSSSFSPDLKDKIKVWTSSLLKNNNLPEGSINFKPFLQIRFSNQVKKEESRLKKILTPLGLNPVFSQSEVSKKPLIRIQVFIAHVKRSFLRNFGVQWPSQAEATLAPQGGTQWKELSASLQALESHGSGQLLASPTLITESGQKAEFHSGGEFPVTTTTQFNNSVQWKRYGLFLKTKSVATFQKKLKIDIDLEMSTLDQSLSAQGVPALMRSQLKTQVSMNTPTPILLSGFLRKTQGDNRSGLPWLQQIPILKPLFSNGSIHNSELELVFVLVPSFYE